jgi:hypothetical protein
MENKKKVIRLTENQLVSIIEKTITEVTNLNENETVENPLLDEGWRDFLGMEKGEEIKKREDEFNEILNKAMEKGLKVNKEVLTKQAKENKFRGTLTPVKGVLIYKPGTTGLGKMAAGTSSQTLGT